MVTFTDLSIAALLLEFINYLWREICSKSGYLLQEPEPIRGRNVDSNLLAGSHGVWQGIFDPGCKFYKNRKGSSPQTVCLLEKIPTSTHAYHV